MKKYLIKLESIIQDNHDLSDYDVLCTAFKQYLSSVSREERQSYIPILQNCLESYKNDYLISLVYKISSYIEDFTYKRNLQHFNDVLIRKNIYLSLKNDIYNEEISQLSIENEPIEILQLIKRRKELLGEFLYKKNSECVVRQLEIISNCHIFDNLDYFIQFLGSSNKITAYNAFKAFYAVKQSNNLFYIKKCIKVEFPLHFITFGYLFIKESDLIVRYNKKGDFLSIKNIFKQYLINDFTITKELNLIIPNNTNFDEEYTEETNFDFLFDQRSYKCFSDCIEF